MNPLRLTILLCAAEVLSMAGNMTFPALVPAFMSEWGIGASDVGWINGVFHAGYVASVPLLVTLTDRIDARRIYVASCALGAASTVAFALAEGPWSAAALRVLAGVGLAGTYMPGLKILSDRVTGPRQGRYVSFYTASFAVGSGASVLLAGFAASALGWRGAHVVSGVAAASALALVWAVPASAPASPPGRALLDFRPVLRNRAAMGYVLAYAAHCWELFGFRGWIVTFLVFSAALAEGRTTLDATPPSVAALATVLLFLGLPASIFGNELATKLGRRRVLVAFMLGSACVAAVIGFAAPLPYWVVAALAAVYAVTVNLDSASLTVGAVGHAAAGQRGATMAVHSFLGFTAAFLGSVAFGEILEAAGGRERVSAWGVAFAAQGAVIALGPLALLWLVPRDRAQRR